MLFDDISGRLHGQVQSREKNPNMTTQPNTFKIVEKKFFNSCLDASGWNVPHGCWETPIFGNGHKIGG